MKPRHHGGGALQEWRTNKNAERLETRAALVANRRRLLAATESRVNQHHDPLYRPFSSLSSDNAHDIAYVGHVPHKMVHFFADVDLGGLNAHASPRLPVARPPSPLSRQSQEPIRAELLSPERLEELAAHVAGRPVLAGGTSGRLLSPHVRDSGRVLPQCYREIAAVIREEGAITPAAEWFVDNFHVADEVVRQVREDLPRGFYRQLPKLAEEPLQGYPRVLGLAWEFVAHTDSRLEAETLQRFVRRFQRVQPLTIGGLWAIPIAVRLVLDVYQDLFGEGSYTGKGLYDVAAFTAALKDRVPENSLLSHNLFEGIFARAGLCDVAVARPRLGPWRRMAANPMGRRNSTAIARRASPFVHTVAAPSRRVTHGAQ